MMPIQLGERFARTVASGDAEGLRELLVPKVNFRALTPGRCWESEDARAVVDEVILGTWFSPPCAITRVLGVDCADVGSVRRVGYRLRAKLPDGDFLIEQQAYFKTQSDKIWWLRILCSGFVRDV